MKVAEQQPVMINDDMRAQRWLGNEMPIVEDVTNAVWRVAGDDSHGEHGQVVDSWHSQALIKMESKCWRASKMWSNTTI